MNHKILLYIFSGLYFCLVINGQSFLYAEEKTELERNLLNTAEILFEQELYLDAASIYQKILITESNEKKDRIRYRLAQSLVLAESYSECRELLEKNLTSLNPEEKYLLAVCDRQLNQCNEAILLLISEDVKNSFYSKEVIFELGLNYFHIKEFSLAKNYFSSILENQNQPMLYILAQLYLAKIELIIDHHQQAKEILNSVSPKINETHPLLTEMTFLLGEVLFKSQQYVKAAHFFEQSKNKKYNQDIDISYIEGQCYLKIAEILQTSSVEQVSLFEKAEKIFMTIIKEKPEERFYLALGQCYLSKAKKLNDATALLKAEEILSNIFVFKTPAARAQALLLRAEAAVNYQSRKELYQQLTSELNKDSPFYAQGWFLQGLNDFNEYQKQQIQTKQILKEAIFAFSKTFELLKNDDISLSEIALKYQILAYISQNTQESLKEAFELLENLCIKQIQLLDKFKNPDEFYYMKAIIATKIGLEAEPILTEALTKYPKEAYACDSLLLLGTLYFKKNNYLEAERIFTQLATEFPDSPKAPEGWFWASQCADLLKYEPSIAKNYRQKVFEHYPQSFYAAEAYFFYYDYFEYLQGTRTSIKHLQLMESKYPQSPFLINAFYLIGLDYKKDRKTEEGILIRRKQLTTAIEAFHKAESLFDSLYQSKLIPEFDLDHYIAIRYRSILERSLANLSIADQSTGAKRQIYLNYAEEVFSTVAKDFNENGTFLTNSLISKESYVNFQEEAQFWLAQTYLKANNDQLAENIFNQMLKKYSYLKINSGYFLSRTWFEKGLIAMRKKEFNQALIFFNNAETTSMGGFLSTDQKLDIWIQESISYREMNELEKSMLTLSKVINDDTISSLRLKAMYLRAEIYELQKRHELAKKQLEALAKKGGEWAIKAKQKLGDDYVY